MMKLNTRALSIAVAITAATSSHAFMMVSPAVSTHASAAFVPSPMMTQSIHSKTHKRQSQHGTALHASVQAQPTVQDEVDKLRSKAAQLRAEVSAMESQRAAEMVKAAERIFEKFDINHDGKITLEELQVGLEKFFKNTIPQQRVKKLLRQFDQNNNGVLELEEFSAIGSIDTLTSRLQAIATEERQEAREVAKAAKKEAELNQLIQKQMELVNDKDDVSGIERIVSVLPYLLPLLDSLQFGRFLLVQHADNPIVAVLSVLYTVYASIPLSGILSFIALNLASSNLSLNKLIRFNAQQSIYLDIALFVPSLIAGLVSAWMTSTAGGSITGAMSEPVAWLEWGNDAVFLSVLVAIGYSVLSSVVGVTPDKIPLLSETVQKRMPTSEMLEEMTRLALLDDEEQRGKKDDIDENRDS